MIFREVTNCSLTFVFLYINLIANCTVYIHYITFIIAFVNLCFVNVKVLVYRKSLISMSEVIQTTHHLDEDKFLNMFFSNTLCVYKAN